MTIASAIAIGNTISISTVYMSIISIFMNQFAFLIELLSKPISLFMNITKATPNMQNNIKVKSNMDIGKIRVLTIMMVSTNLRPEGETIMPGHPKGLKGKK